MYLPADRGMFQTAKEGKNKKPDTEQVHIRFPKRRKVITTTSSIQLPKPHHED